MPTPSRNLRVADQLWNDAKAAAARRNTTVTSYLVGKLTELVEHDKTQQAFVNGLTATPAADRQERQP